MKSRLLKVLGILLRISLGLVITIAGYQLPEYFATEATWVYYMGLGIMLLGLTLIVSVF